MFEFIILENKKVIMQSIQILFHMHRVIFLFKTWNGGAFLVMYTHMFCRTKQNKCRKICRSCRLKYIYFLSSHISEQPLTTQLELIHTGKPKQLRSFCVSRHWRFMRPPGRERRQFSFFFFQARVHNQRHNS